MASKSDITCPSVALHPTEEVVVSRPNTVGSVNVVDFEA